MMGASYDELRLMAWLDGADEEEIAAMLCEALSDEKLEELIDELDRLLAEPLH